MAATLAQKNPSGSTGRKKLPRFGKLRASSWSYSRWDLNQPARGCDGLALDHGQTLFEAAATIVRSRGLPD